MQFISKLYIADVIEGGLDYWLRIQACGCMDGMAEISQGTEGTALLPDLVRH